MMIDKMPTLYTLGALDERAVQEAIYERRTGQPLEAGQDAGLVAKVKQAIGLMVLVVDHAGVKKGGIPMIEWVFPRNAKFERPFGEEVRVLERPPLNSWSFGQVGKAPGWAYGETTTDGRRVRIRAEMPLIDTLETAAHEEYHVLEVLGVVPRKWLDGVRCTEGASDFGREVRSRIEVALAAGREPLKIDLPRIGG